MQKFLIPAALLSLIVGCGPSPIPPVIEAALFYDVEEERRFSQDEINWRTANAPWNLARDYRTNLTFERECNQPDN